jgi:hydroxymethylpyrimidine/phosphomethylpyrimidine kinase
MQETPPVVLTIAGFDPSSGAGVTADIKTIAAHVCYGVAAITALTIQSTAGVRRVVPVDPEVLTETLHELRRDVKVSAVHIGMLGSGSVAAGVADFLGEARLPNVVLDPILTSSSGTTLLDEAGRDVLVQRLMPLADVVTPNVDEASALTRLRGGSEDQMKRTAERLHELGAKAVVITGGHLDRVIDLLSVRGQGVQAFQGERLESPNTHGTGCAFATATACQLALGRDLLRAVQLAKAYVWAAIKDSYSIGAGAGPVNHMARMKNSGEL